MKTGCKYWSNCFTCPFSDCKYDEDDYYAKWYAEHREEVLQKRKDWRNKHKEEIAEKRKAKRARQREAKEQEVPV